MEYKKTGTKNGPWSLQIVACETIAQVENGPWSLQVVATFVLFLGVASLLVFLRSWCSFALGVPSLFLLCCFFGNCFCFASCYAHGNDDNCKQSTVLGAFVVWGFAAEKKWGQ
jgi:hypothetical protein